MTKLLTRFTKAIWFALALLTLGGVIAAFVLPVGLFPQINYPRITVSIDAGERDPQQMAAQITRPLEIALRGVPGITHIRTTTSRGSAEAALSFNWGEDMVAATLATQAALANSVPDMPTGTRFTVRRSDPTIFPVLGLALTSKSRDPQALRQFAELKLRPVLSTVPGIAGVDITGGAAREVAVAVDAGHLQALGLTMSDVVTALGNANNVQGVGKIEDRHRLYLALVDNRVTSSADLLNTPIKAGVGPAGGLVTLGQIATITPSAQPLWTRVTANGTSAVLVNLRQSLSGDTVKIVQAIDARLKGSNLATDITITPFYDQSELVTGAATAVRDAILLGAVLAGLVLFFFLRSSRLMLITGLMLPAVLAATCLGLYVFGLSFNMMTLGGLAAAVGLVVDDAVVMLEHIMRRMVEEEHAGQVEQRGQHMSPLPQAAGSGFLTEDNQPTTHGSRQREGENANRSVLAAAAEMGIPLLGSTLATIVVFIPLAFISGVTGGFFKALAVTMVAALLVSLLYSRFVIPLLAAHWLRVKDAEAAEKAGGVMLWLNRRFTGTTTRIQRRPALVVAAITLILGVLGVVAYMQVPSGFMPKMDEGGFILDYKAKPGAALSDTDAILRQVEALITETPEVASYSRRTGAQLGGGLTEADEGDLFIRLKDGSRRNIEDVMAEVRAKVIAQVPGIDVETAQLMEDLIGDLTNVPQPIEIKLFGDDPDALKTSAQSVAAGIGKVDGVVEIRDGLRVAGDAIVVKVDRAAAQLHGLDPSAVAAQLETQIGGTIATQFQLGEQVIGVRVRAPADARQRAAQIGDLSLRAADGHQVYVRQIATVSTNPGQRQLTREDLAPFVAVTARLEGRDLGSAMVEVKKAVANLNLPATIRVEYGGLYAVQQASFLDLGGVFVAALLLSALLLTLLFNKWRYTIGVITTVMLSACAVMIGLWVTGTELNISALMGLTMVVGMITELAIFYLYEVDDAQLHEARDDLTMANHHPTSAIGDKVPTDIEARLLQAGLGRLRPILMSALIAILTLAPLALGLSRGAGLQQPLATAIIFGLTIGAPLVLLFLPATLRVGVKKAQAVA